MALPAGLVRQFVLVLILVRGEQRTLRWPVVREALCCAGRPVHAPGTGEAGCGWVVVPLIVLMFSEEFVPSLPHDAGREFSVFARSAPGHAILTGG